MCSCAQSESARGCRAMAASVLLSETRPAAAVAGAVQREARRARLRRPACGQKSSPAAACGKLCWLRCPMPRPSFRAPSLRRAEHRESGLWSARRFYAHPRFPAQTLRCCNSSLTLRTAGAARSCPERHSVLLDVASSTLAHRCASPSRCSQQVPQVRRGSEGNAARARRAPRPRVLHSRAMCATQQGSAMSSLEPVVQASADTDLALGSIRAERDPLSSRRRRRMLLFGRSASAVHPARSTALCGTAEVTMGLAFCCSYLAGDADSMPGEACSLNVAASVLRRSGRGAWWARGGRRERRPIPTHVASRGCAAAARPAGFFGSGRASRAHRRGRDKA
ncbi:hypothetical protein FA09DRAFT_163481 [Tilletiopsis washingtonensis]|uniref:Uncharacterized protein n=1 Tax=Tilletiopsis washingtonensis TaxID=58919 RepID=A0A316Z1T6_9BASI|nr:hypothetical protein FA09DRAFT_163481 [Tilletiopsis washingtonensis]PWN94928.1 hypothetical protein FA09DRAFT_163481 [Tilletiopsis washingtonensis]